MILMIIILYLILLVIFLVLLKNLFLPKENFHGKPLISTAKVVDGDVDVDVDGIVDDTHKHTTQSIFQNAVNRIPNIDSNNPIVPPNQTTKNVSEEETPLITNETPIPKETLQKTTTEAATQSNSQTSEQPSGNQFKIVTSDNAKIIAQKSLTEEAEKVKSVTAPVDDKCCGVNIYERKLHNINKCIKQHIKNVGNKLIPKYNNWKEVDEEENTCQSPQHVLAKTSNCYDIVNDYRDNINSLLCLSNINTEKCSYNHTSDRKLEGEKLSDKEKMAVFIGNIKCSDSNTFVLVEFPKGSYYNVKKCD